MKTTRFVVDIDEDALVDLQRRLELTAFSDDLHHDDWVDGMPTAVLQRVVGYWRDHFNWRAAERRINEMPQFRAEVGGLEVHFVHVQGVDENSPALILTHGWPGSFVEMLDLIPRLTDPSNNGLPGFRSFSVVVPSLPGFAFSEAPRRPGTNSRVVASMWHELMQGLGYHHYFAQGGDIGSSVSIWMARLYPQAVRALHLNFISSGYQPPLGKPERPLSPAEAAWRFAREDWMQHEGGYSHVHSTKPQTLAHALVDSPVGLAAWIIEKFFAWSDGKKDLFSRFDIDTLLTNVSLYWFSANVASTLRMYKENAAQPLAFATGERIIPPLCFASYPREIVNPPREWLERVFQVARWSELPAGGHFAALEQPESLAREIHQSFGLFQ
ncbi:epoxide hydrolase family protein [Rhizobacter sp. Root404]|uniref:epoxide hydrolase family protein n=1 Tax=Rhizobacter sp. Root404 TaxID=1736528 RepID=UPI00070177C1|nr:epoxide hydrolase family protein [Rhizobacter sp. Root404]KQW38423.1 multidrug MFS transporter [Rhizobacter sp. Root404]